MKRLNDLKVSLKKKMNSMIHFYKDTTTPLQKYHKMRKVKSL